MRSRLPWAAALTAVALLLTSGSPLDAWQSAPLPHQDIGPYLEWLTRDVVYIISNRERAAFLKLTTDDERQMFIEQFWERRNPTPSAPENAFKREHYRRITFANQHYSLPGIDGWRTDRGHVYIIYGPPDEIASGPKGVPNTEEKWAYWHAGADGGFFTFVDRTGEGEYRLAPTGR